MKRSLTSPFHAPLSCSYDSEYQGIYDPSYETTIAFLDEEYLDEEEVELGWDDFYPTPDSSGIGRA